MSNLSNVVNIKDYAKVTDLVIPEEWELQFYDPVAELYPQVYYVAFDRYRDILGEALDTLEVYWAPDRGDDGEYTFVVRDPKTGFQSAYGLDEELQLIPINLPRK